ncbi:MAG TPA: peptidylprolyl isomerase [Flavobacterium sp.]|jgi:peptidyl-prolyl cis-trans isomerase SurA
MKLKQLLFGLILCLPLASFAQNVTKEVLFTIDGKPYYTDEFSRVYKKNLDLVKDESQRNLDQYLQLFVGYKLKINKAHKLGLQDGKQYQTELKSYRTQLAKNYNTDSKVTNELVREAYERSVKEVNASHILILVDENASPADTLSAFKKISDIRERAVKGEDFGTLAAQVSQDPSAKENKGSLGYFSAFRMVYPFEAAAFKTKKGEISKPLRTRFGYHIIKVHDIRDNRGELTVAHIMILKPSKDDLAAEQKASSTINDIYKKLQQGENFSELARQFSEDKSSAGKGGQLNRFGSGQLSSEEFENVAFSLTKEGEISPPFESAFGWHIVKLISKHPVKTFDEMKAELENKVGKDERSRLIAESLNEKLRKKYPVKRNAKLYTAIQKTVNDKVYDGSWTAPENKTAFEGSLFDLQGKAVKGTDFLDYINTQQKSGLTIKPVTKLTDDLYEKFVDQQLNTYYNDNLENEFPEFAAVMEEYRDGLLLFDLMEKEIWERSKTDTIGLKKYYDTHQSEYQWKSRVEATVISSTNQDIIKKAQKFLKQKKDVDFIKSKLNTADVVNVMASNGTYEEGNPALPKATAFKKGISDITKEGEYYFVTKVEKVLPAGPKSFEDARGKVTNDYQQYLEENWVKDLKQEFTVNVNNTVFENVKLQLKS